MMAKVGPYRPAKGSIDIATRVGERPGFETYVTNPERAFDGQSMAGDRDLTPSPEEFARRMRREEALRIWHTDPTIAIPFEEFWRRRESSRLRQV